jgi:hypothetical protein
MVMVDQWERQLQWEYLQTNIRTSSLRVERPATKKLVAGLSFCTCARESISPCEYTLVAIMLDLN